MSKASVSSSCFSPVPVHTIQFLSHYLLLIQDTSGEVFSLLYLQLSLKFDNINHARIKHCLPNSFASGLYLFYFKKEVFSWTCYFTKLYYRFQRWKIKKKKKLSMSSGDADTVDVWNKESTFCQDSGIKSSWWVLHFCPTCLNTSQS